MRTLLPFMYVDAIARSGSIRQAAEQLSITPSALNRRLLSMEEELGCQIFERLPSGVRLNTAGEILLVHIRNQLSSMEQVKSRIADLSGLRKGHISLAVTGEIIGPYLNKNIAQSILKFPEVTISVLTLDRQDVEPCLLDYQADFAIIVEPPALNKVQILNEWEETIMCVMPTSHPLASKRNVRLYECAEFAAIKPPKTLGIRNLIETACKKIGIEIHGTMEGAENSIAISLIEETGLISFALPSSLPDNLSERGLTSKPLSTRDITPAHAVIAHLKGRAINVAAARFCEEILV